MIRTRLLIAALALALAAPVAAQRRIRINLGTVVPEDSPWHEVLQQMRQDWKRISGGSIELRIYAGGALGDDVEMLRKARTGKLQAIAMTGIGLSRIDTGVDALQVPMLFESYEQFDYVHERMAPELERRIAEKGFQVLVWSDGGWAHFFSKAPSATLDDIREQKLWISAGDPRTEQIYKDFGFNVVPLPLTEMTTALQTGLLETVLVPPLYAMLNGSYRRAGNMTDLAIVPVIGGIVIANQAWERIPADLRPKLAAASEDAGEKQRTRIRRMGDDAVEEMRERGLNVVSADRDDWQTELEEAYPKLRGSYAPADLFDEAKRLRDEFRSR